MTQKSGFFRTGQMFVPSNQVTPVPITNYTFIRAAANNVHLQKAANADTTHLQMSVRPFAMTSPARGFRINTIDVVYEINIADLTTHTAVLSSVVHANSTAAAVTAITQTGALSILFADADPLVTTLTVTTPTWITADHTDVRLEIEVVAPATSTYDFHGVYVNFDYNTDS